MQKTKEKDFTLVAMKEATLMTRGRSQHQPENITPKMANERIKFALEQGRRAKLQAELGLTRGACRGVP